MKINYNAVGQRVIGAGGGTIAAGFVNKILAKENSEGKPLMNEYMRGAVLLVLGATLPEVVGGSGKGKKKAEWAEAAGAAILGQGVETIVKKIKPDLIAGFDDEAVSGADDEPESVGDLEAEEMVSGPMDYEATSHQGVYGPLSD